MADETPCWDLLPDRATEFFGLGGEYDRKALKRAYNGWLRRYKPETHPEEFQRIHSAYKALEARLVYGVATPAAAVVCQSVSAGLGGGAESSLHEELHSATPAEAYARRIAHPAPTPETFRELAILSDVVEADEHDFLGWLLVGLEKFPTDAALGALVAAYCRDGAVGDDLPDRLPVLARCLPAAQFAFATESVWRRMLRERLLSEVLETWEACWSDRGADATQSRARLMLRLLPAAMCFAPEPWLDQQMAWLSEDFALLPDDADETFVRLAMLREHLSMRDEFLAGGPVHEQIDELIVDLCSLEEMEADRRFLAWQLAVREDPESILEEFPPGMPACGPAYAVLEDYCIQAEQRLDPEGRGPERDRAIEMADDTLNRISEKTNGSWPASMWSLRTASSFLVTYPLFVALLVVAGELLARVVGRIDYAPWIFFGLCPTTWWFHRRVRGWRAGVRFRAAQRCYVTIWRHELLDLMRRSQLPAVIVHGLLEDLPPRGRHYRDWACAFLMHDVGIAIWSLGNRAG